MNNLEAKVKFERGEYMDNMNTIKTTVLGVLGIVGSVIAKYLGGWDAALQTLIIFMAVDYFTGMLVAAVFHKSEKTVNGRLDSRAGFKGLCRKGMTLVMVLVGSLLDGLSGTDVIRNAVVIAYCINEAVSIVENAGIMGLPIPSIIRKALEILQNKTEQQGVE
jgi:toxin secretion/phage lysis holin